MPPLRTLASTAVVLCLAVAGGAVAELLGMPLPWLLGGLLTVGAAAILGLKVAGGPLTFPMWLRMGCIPVIGVLIGGAVGPETLVSVPQWWPSLAMLLVFVPVAFVINYAIFRRVGRYDRPTAYWCSAPGGLIESVEAGSAAGGDARLLTVQHFSRIAVTVTVVPLLFTWLTGQAVGSAAGARIEGAPLGWEDAVMLALAALVGGLSGRMLNFPAGIITGPIIVSGILHATGITHAQPPDLVVKAAQVVIGASLGIRFAGLERRQIVRGLWLAALSVAAILALGTALALAVSGMTGQATQLIVLAYAPGGIVEMGLIALSLGASPVVVTLHHILRILLAVWLGALAWRRLDRGRAEAAPAKETP